MPQTDANLYKRADPAGNRRNLRPKGDRMGVDYEHLPG